jgi:hypothetical protein
MLPRNESISLGQQDRGIVCVTTKPKVIEYIEALAPLLWLVTIVDKPIL